MDEETTDAFLDKAAELIIPDVRLTVKPIVCGGAYEVYSGDESDVEVRESTKESRRYIIRRLLEAGFSKPLCRWNRRNQAQSLVIDLGRRQVVLMKNRVLQERWGIS
jgi:hypothetical protein